MTARGEPISRRERPAKPALSRRWIGGARPLGLDLELREAGDRLPASSAVQVADLVRPEFLMEAEVFAVLPE